VQEKEQDERLLFCAASRWGELLRIAQAFWFDQKWKPGGLRYAAAETAASTVSLNPRDPHCYGRNSSRLAKIFSRPRRCMASAPLAGFIC